MSGMTAAVRRTRFEFSGDSNGGEVDIGCRVLARLDVVGRADMIARLFCRRSPLPSSFSAVLFSLSLSSPLTMSESRNPGCALGW